MCSDTQANGHLMSRDRILGIIKDGILIKKEAINERFLPLYFNDKNNADQWLKTRVIDKGNILYQE